MPSLFYKATFERRFPLTFLFFEDISLSSGNLNEESSEKEVEMAIRRSLKRCYPDLKAKADDVAYVSERLEKLAKETAEKAGDGETKKKLDFASSFSDWAGSLLPHEICLVAAKMDYFLALRLYSEVDRDDVTDMSTQWMKMEWEKIRVGYESVAYGFGGGYKGGTPADGMEVDVSTEDNTKGEAINPMALASVKF